MIFADDQRAQGLLRPGAEYFGTVVPTRDRPKLQDRDARDAAMRKLREFIALAVFQLTGDAANPTYAFSIPIANIFTDQPDDLQDLPQPGVGFLPARGAHVPFGIGPATALENTRDVFGQGTVLLKQSEYVEQFTVEVWTDKVAMRRAILAGLKQLFRLSDASYALQLKLPNYYDQVAAFTLDDSQPIDDDADVRNRRRGHLYVELRVTDVSLVNYVELDPRVAVEELGPGVELVPEV